jgi:hypothetical protein
MLSRLRAYETPPRRISPLSGDIDEWDGLIEWFVRIAGRSAEVLGLREGDANALQWYEAANAARGGLKSAGPVDGVRATARQRSKEHGLMSGQ